jgi:O-methyltransferase
MLQPLRNQRFDNGAPGVLPQSFLVSWATYSPWLTDGDFLEDDAETGRRSLVDIYRRYELAQMVRQTSKVPGDILEVGVWRGGTGCLMALTAQRIGSKATVFLCDTFVGVVKAGVNDIAWKGGEFSNTSKEMVEEFVKSKNISNVVILPGIFPDETGDPIADRQFSLCHIDVDVYASAKDVFEWVWPRLSIGGVVIFDDYGFRGTRGVTLFANECSLLRTGVFVYNLNGHALMVKTA